MKLPLVLFASCSDLVSGHGYMQNPISYSQLEENMRNNRPDNGEPGRFNGGGQQNGGLIGTFRYCRGCGAGGNGAGQKENSKAAECGGQFGGRQAAEAENYNKGLSYWRKHYEAASTTVFGQSTTAGPGVPQVRAGDIEISGALPADHGGQAWIMISCDAEIEIEGQTEWIYLKRKGHAAGNLPNSQPSNENVFDWSPQSLGRSGFSAIYEVPEGFGCPTGEGVGRWIWKTANNCNDADNVGRSTETFILSEAASNRGICRSPPETFISCFSFETDVTGAAPQSTVPNTMGGSQMANVAQPSPPGSNPMAQSTCTAEQCPMTYCQCDRYNAGVCAAESDNSYCFAECCCLFNGCTSPNSVRVQDGARDAGGIADFDAGGGVMLKQSAATGRYSNCKPCSPGIGMCQLQTCAAGCSTETGGDGLDCGCRADDGSKVTKEECESVCTQVYAETDGQQMFKVTQDEICGGRLCACDALGPETATPMGMMCRVCTEGDIGCMASGEVDGAWCVEHCAAQHFSDEACGVIPMEGMTAPGQLCVCSRAMAQQVVTPPIGTPPMGPGVPNPIGVPPMMGPGVPNPIGVPPMMPVVAPPAMVSPPVAPPPVVPVAPGVRPPVARPPPPAAVAGATKASFALAALSVLLVHFLA